MPDIVIPAEIREPKNKNEARRLRRSGFIPGVVYGQGRAATSVAVNPKDILSILRSPKGTNTLFKIRQKSGDKERVVMLRDYQYDPLSGGLLHVDMVRVDLDKPIEVKVQVEPHGVAPGVKDEGGFVDIVMREIHLLCLPTRIPDSIRIDVSGLALHQGVRIRDIDFGEGIEVLHNRDLTVLHIQVPKKEPTAEELAAVAAAAAAGPEVIAKGKVAVEGEEGAPAADAAAAGKDAPAKGKEAPAKGKEAAGSKDDRKSGREEKKPPKDKK